MADELNRFSELWDGFAASFRKRLETEREKQKLSYSVCTLLLNDEKLCWNTDDNPCGQWLEDLRNTQPQKADLILSIIMDDVKLSDTGNDKHLTVTDIIGCGVIPFVLAMVTMMICNFMKLPFVTTIISEIVIELVAIISYLLSPLSKKSGKAVIDKYTAQLDKYKRVISEIVSGMQ